ncbi:Cytochrome oxidase c subunit VIb [Aphelenchoides fujianensis]|nr:Cytochrome oxidase c subunit VIb [Aphelenchoides fujianensis]
MEGYWVTTHVKICRSLQLQWPTSRFRRVSANVWRRRRARRCPTPESPNLFDRELHEKSKEQFAWGAPYDARFPQVRKQRHCFAYFVDYHRCKELMGEDYQPCKFFQNVYKDFCPKFWVEKWNELVDEGRFPAKFDR